MIRRYSRAWYAEQAAFEVLDKYPRVEVEANATVIAFDADDDRPVAPKGRAGAYVQAWVWVDGTEYHDENHRDRNRGTELT